MGSLRKHPSETFTFKSVHKLKVPRQTTVSEYLPEHLPSLQTHTRAWLINYRSAGIHLLIISWSRSSGEREDYYPLCFPSTQSLWGTSGGEQHLYRHRGRRWWTVSQWLFKAPFHGSTSTHRFIVPAPELHKSTRISGEQPEMLHYSL